MSFDPYRANEVPALRQKYDWLLRDPGSDFYRGGIAGEDIGIQAQADAPRFPLRPIDKSGVLLYLDGTLGTHFKMDSDKYLQYSGILYRPVYSGQALHRVRVARVRLKAGSEAVVAGHFVMADPEPDTGLFPAVADEPGTDVINQFSTKLIEYFTPAAGHLANTDVTIILPDGCWKLRAITSASIYDASAAGNVALTVVTAVPGAGEIRVSGDDTVELGTALADGDILSLEVEVYDDTKYKHTVGLAETAGSARTGATPAGASDIEVELF